MKSERFRIPCLPVVFPIFGIDRARSTMNDTQSLICVWEMGPSVLDHRCRISATRPYRLEARMEVVQGQLKRKLSIHQIIQFLFDSFGCPPGKDSLAWPRWEETLPHRRHGVATRITVILGQWNDRLLRELDAIASFEMETHDECLEATTR